MYVIMHGDRKTACIDICLIGNMDWHWRNWGLLIDNRTNRPVSLHPLVDFNQAFHPCDDVKEQTVRQPFRKEYSSAKRQSARYQRSGWTRFPRPKKSGLREGWKIAGY